MMSTENRYKTLSKRIHRILGLWGLIWIFLLTISGILLNHPDYLADLDLPRSWLPGDYVYRDWNRASFRGAVELPDGKKALYGEAGIWLAQGYGAIPKDWSEGLAQTAWGRDTRALFREGDSPLLYAATRVGLYVRDISGFDGWREIPLGNDKNPVVDVFSAEDSVYSLTRSNLFRAEVAAPTDFRRVELGRIFEPYDNPSLFRLVFDVHSGDLWGLPGRIIVDILGAASLLLGVTGTFFWYKKKRRGLVRTKTGVFARRGLKLHIRLGAWLFLPIGIIALTGIFQRPPFLIAIAPLSYYKWLHPAPAPENPWEDKFRKALYDEKIRRIVISTSIGVHEADIAYVQSGRADLVRVYRNPPISVMGATVFKKEARGDKGWKYLVGSMSGLYRWDRATGKSRDAFTGEPPSAPSGPPVGERTVMGIYEAEGQLIWADYSKGLSDADSKPVAWPMPPEIRNGGRISLWHALFEIHNGRIFEFALGWWYWIVVPLSGLAFLAVLGTGAYDRLVRGRRKG